MLDKDTNHNACDLISNDMTASAFHEWITVDKILETSGPVTEDDVCSKILVQNFNPINENLSNDEPEIELPSIEEMTAALPILKREEQMSRK